MNPRTPSMRPDNYDPPVTLCKATGDLLQLNVLHTLANDSFGALELVQIFAIDQSGMSHHLKVLAQTRLVAMRHEDNVIFYRRSLPLAERTSGTLYAALLEGVDEQALPDNVRTRIDIVHAQRATVSQDFFAHTADKSQVQQDLITRLPQHHEDMLALLDTLAFIPDVTALEVGPEDGGFLPEPARCFRQVTVLGSSVAMPEPAHRRCKEEGLGSVRLELVDVLQDAAEPASCTVLNMVLHHFAAPAEALKQLARLVHPGGSLLVTDLCRHSQGWTREACGNLQLSFEQEDLVQRADAAGLTPGESLHIGSRNDFQIQVRHFAKDAPENRLIHR